MIKDKLDITLTKDQMTFINEFKKYFDRTYETNPYKKVERNKDIFFKLLLKEKTIKELADEYEISITRVRDIFNKGMRMLRLYKRIRFFNYTMNDYTKEKYA
tara:strand:+ start:48 stop:353 length:306 start_codon:yes stop_codon:yes gene_type:complete